MGKSRVLLLVLLGVLPLVATLAVAIDPGSKDLVGTALTAVGLSLGAAALFLSDRQS
jgi:hypothetical protein